MGPADRPTITNLCLVQFSFLQKPCGCFVPFDDDDGDDFFDWTTANLCDAAQIAERAAASGHLRNHESFWEKLVNCNSSDDMATMASMKTVLAVIMMMILLSMIVYGSDREFHLLDEVP